MNFNILKEFFIALKKEYHIFYKGHNIIFGWNGFYQSFRPRSYYFLHKPLSNQHNHNYHFLCNRNVLYNEILQNH